MSQNLTFWEKIAILIQIFKKNFKNLIFCAKFWHFSETSIPRMSCVGQEMSLPEVLDPDPVDYFFNSI